MHFFAQIIATWFYSGYAPIAPGTFGSGAAIVVLLLLRLLYPFEFGSLFLLAIVVTGLSIWATGKFAKKIKLKDPGFCVSDEAAGMYFSLIFVPITYQTLAVGFLLFRFFDIVKIQPARILEKLPGGWGITLDDVAAGIYTAVSLYLLVVFSNHFGILSIFGLIAKEPGGWLPMFFTY